MKLFGTFFGPKKENPEEQTGEQNNVVDLEEWKKQKQEKEEIIFKPDASELADKILEKDELLRKEQRLAEEKEKAEALERKE